jgi:hypothetical protein
MQRNVLHAEEILSARQALRNRHGDLALAHAGPAQSAASDRGAFLVDLEPGVSAAVPGGGGLPAGDLCHVELESARVRDGALGGEADGGSGGDFVGALGGGSRGELVAADLVGCDLRGVSIRCLRLLKGERVAYVCHGSIALVVCRFTDILPCAGC